MFRKLAARTIRRLGVIGATKLHPDATSEMLDLASRSRVTTVR
jgi:hypothetical protein